MRGVKIVSHADFNVDVLSDGTVRISQPGYSSQMRFTPDIAAKLAQGLLGAVTYVSDEIANSLEDVPDAVEEAKKAIDNLDKAKDRIDLLE